jgi:nucleoside-diphosphate-sugar epimerase
MSGLGADGGLTILEVLEEGLDEAPPVVLLTGAAGLIGKKLRAAWAGRFEVIGLDIDPKGDPAVVACDLAVWDEEWAGLLDEVDVVVHLAGNPDPEAGWPDLVGPNLDGVNHLFLAAANAGVPRIVFASSNHAMGGYREGEGVIATDLPARPDGAYGATKVVAERLGKALAELGGVTFVSLRIGWVASGEPGDGPPPDAWAWGMWLSERDLIELFTRAVEAQLDEGAFVVVNGVSRSTAGRWEDEDGWARLGYVPRDDAEARQGVQRG